jgi:hypothetical protein
MARRNQVFETAPGRVQSASCPLMDLLSLLWIAILVQFQRYYCTINETNDCGHCQTSGKVLADRALLPLLKASWPGTLDEL